MTTRSLAADPKEAAAVADLPRRMIAAWSENDAEAFAQLFTEDATMVLPGDVYLSSREEIRAYMAEAYAGPLKGTGVAGAPLGLRFLSESSGVIVTRGGILAPGQSEVSPEREIRATWVVAKHDGAWYIAAYHNSPIQAG